MTWQVMLDFWRASILDPPPSWISVFRLNLDFKIHILKWIIQSMVNKQEGQFLKKLWCSVGGEVWLYQLSW